ncbi:MAG: hypothetical protein ABUL44_04890, partial [Flavobacterium sp.]
RKDDATLLQEGDALMYTNSAKWQQNANYGQTTLYEESGDSSYKNYVMYWNLRNKKVVTNVLDAIEGKKYRHVVVFMGNMHIPNMKKHLKDQKKVLVKDF